MGKRLAAAVLLLTILLTGCGQDEPARPSETPQTPPTPPPPAGASTRLTLPYYPNVSLHPITGTNRANLVLTGLVYQCLFELDNTFTPQRVLCDTAFPSEDGLTWTFTLREARFSDETPLTAGDVAYSLELARTSSLYASRLSDVRKISVSGSSVTVTLSRPNGAFPALLDIPIIRDRRDGSLPLGTGIYTFVEDSAQLRLEKWRDAGVSFPDEISLFPLKSADDLSYAFDAGDISMLVCDPTGSDTPGQASGCNIYSYPTTVMLYVGFQTQLGPCQDAAVRQAISLALDRATVSDTMLAGYADAACLPFSPVTSMYSAGHARAGDYDPAAAAQLLTEAGYTFGSDGLLTGEDGPLSLVLLVNTDNSFKLSIAEHLTGALTQMGIAVELKKLSWDDYLTAVELDAYDLYLGETVLTADFDLSALLTAEGSLNYGDYLSDEMTALLNDLRQADDADRAQAVLDLLDRFQADTPFAPLCFKNYSALAQDRAVSGLTPTRQNPFYHLDPTRFDAEA